MKKLIILAIVLMTVSCSKNSFMGGSPIIIYFTSSSSSIISNDNVTLSWDISDATSVRISNVGDVPLKGTAVISPKVTTVYNLSASNKNALVQQSLTVTVK